MSGHQSDNTASAAASAVVVPAKVRSSQRAPRSCMRCAAKRIRCDKSIPCQTCIARGLEAVCTRETVRVKGKVVLGNPGSEVTRNPLQELEEENRRLREALENLRASSAPSPTPPTHSTATSTTTTTTTTAAAAAAAAVTVTYGSDSATSDAATTGTGPAEMAAWPYYGAIPTVTEIYENDVNAAALTATRPSTVRARQDVCVPSQRCSHYLLEHGVEWTSWIHFALHVPTFRLEHAEVWARSTVTPVLQRDPFWLAIYFSFLSVTLLFLDEQEAVSAELPHDVVTLLENWYDASIYFLDQANYLREHDMRTVQAIAILLGLYKNMGDFAMHSTHLACGIRIAQNLHLDSDAHNASASLIDNEVRRRVWWTLVIVEWLQRPNGVPFVRESDFDVALPLLLDDEELIQQSGDPSFRTGSPRPRQVQYHLAMIAISKLWHRFRASLAIVRKNPEKLETLVLQTDEALANVIDDLPAHLQEDSTAFDGEDGPPWIPWQRNSLSMSILYYRMAINRVLQDQWVQSPNSCARTQSICLGSARAIVSLADRYTQGSARNRPWAIASNLFSAAITLAVEARFSDADTALTYTEDVKRCIVFLSAIRDRNVVAARALEVLESCLAEVDQPLPLPFP